MYGSSKFRTFLRHPGMNGGGGSSGSSKVVTEIPAELKPLATAYTQKAMTLADQPFEPYTDKRFADLTQYQNQGINMAANRALQGSDTFDAADAALNSFYNAGPNPYLDAMFQQASGNVMKNVNSNYALAGRLGSNSHADTYSQNLADLATQMYGGAYDADQNRKLQAISQAPTFANQAYTDAAQLLNAGQIQQDQAQNRLDFNYEQFQNEMNKPYQDLAAMAGVFGSNLGSTSTTKSSGGGK